MESGSTLQRHVSRGGVRGQPDPRPARREPRVRASGPLHRRPQRSGRTTEVRPGAEGRRIDDLVAGCPRRPSDLLAVVQEGRPPEAQEDDRDRPGDRVAVRLPVASDGRRQACCLPFPVVVREGDGRPGVRPEEPFPQVDRRREGLGRPGRLHQRPVEDQVAVPGVLRREGRIPGEQLADRHPARALVDDRPEAFDQLREVVLVEIVEVVEPAPRRIARNDQVVAELRVLQEGVEDVEPEAIHPASQPATDHRPLGGLDGRVAPVQLGLADEERVVVELAALRDPLPAGSAEERHPVVRRQRVPVRVVARRVTPQIEVGERAVPGGLRSEEPGVLVARVVHHEIEDHLQPAGGQAARLSKPASGRTAGRPPVVADVVPRSRPGDGRSRQPDRVDVDPVGPKWSRWSRIPRRSPTPLPSWSAKLRG